MDILQMEHPQILAGIGVGYREQSIFTARSVAQLGIAMISCLSVRPSVTLVDCDHMRLNSCEIISRLISLTFLLSADPTPRIYSEGNTPKF